MAKKADKLTTAPQPLTPEQQARIWRETIYGPISNESWANCKDKWLEASSFAWLQKTVEADTKKKAAVK